MFDQPGPLTVSGLVLRSASRIRVPRKSVPFSARRSRLGVFGLLDGVEPGAVGADDQDFLAGSGPFGLGCCGEERPGECGQQRGERSTQRDWHHGDGGGIEAEPSRWGGGAMKQQNSRWEDNQAGRRPASVPRFPVAGTVRRLARISL